MKTANWEEFVADTRRCMENGTYDFTKNGKCSKCGNCCTALLPLQESEVTRLKKLIKDRHLKPHKQPIVVQAIDLTCPFLSDDNLCQIYDERPLICKIFKCNSGGKPSMEDLMRFKEPIVAINVRDLFENT